MAKITKKSYKRKKIVAGAAIFLSIALVSTGFAAFVITSQATASVEPGGSVGKATLNSIGLEITNSDEIESFRFEPLKDDIHGRVRYDERYPDAYENLSVTIKGKVTNANYLGKLTAELVEMELIGDDYKADKTKTNIYKAANLANDENGIEYITVPECFYKTTDISNTLVRNGNEATFEYTISFGWGSFFQYVNPGLYYDGIKYNGQPLDDPETPLNKTEDEILMEMAGLRNTIYGEQNVENEDQVITPRYKILIKAETN